jgi:hypothetical protein
MAQRRKSGVTRDDPAEQERRDQEVLRANRELAAYFKGQRTEREARAALKIVKAFVRDRERRDAASRPPLPGLRAPKSAKDAAKRKTAGDRGQRRRHKLHHAAGRGSSKRLAAVLPIQDSQDAEPPPAADEPSSE